MEDFFYKQPVPIDFGAGKIRKLPEIIKQTGGKKGILISAPSMLRQGIAQDIMKEAGGALTAVFSSIQQNPTVKNTDDCARMLREEGADFAVAIGGGSVLDCAKAAACIAQTPYSASAFLAKAQTLVQPGIPLIAIPTTSGTASEVTNVSVLTDTKKGIKALISSDFLYPAYALVDPELTLSCPKHVTASSGLDVLAHSLEAYYGKKHQPYTDMAAERAAALVFEYLLPAYHEPGNLQARAKMSEASVTAGLAFNMTQTAAAHACSYPLTQEFGIAHGEACAFTLPSFWRLNSVEGPESGRLEAFSRCLGFKDADALAGRIDEMKKEMGLITTLEEAGIETEADLDRLVAASFAPNMQNSPVNITKDKLKVMYSRLAGGKVKLA
ncbi:iron-containing alcohol dehydrogenase family protein [Weizmannia coagulans]|jgi:alcohol dehydrogenase class IV|uniref:Iron-containing alcohol dehydrogenase n=3 Tax=Heyndrickxia TaxID=2837504 RepID=G2TR89_HEYCO|nr:MULTISPECIES: iron-containing alcohol dehydrogenase family protein [Heyndrickxia]NWN94992.1 iron-containing alcohol dehydrogenase [Bacillus sp. (in: firmicutes)]AEP00165.1 iron-containing alcohol dehydrogenase [Heyndrickxia coagulans 36D1]AJO24534.1 iron-containing alcohol dehydrogenase [Heyndrickxia coagulans]AKN54009.1 Alcohol dehydrogenase [Heyndrickxia coagulans]ATW84333.1 alcohol dehydrogenase [Heyndrickxia coagulans]